MPSLELKLKSNTLGNYELQDGASITIGRREDNDVVIEDPAVSGHHAKIESLGERFVLIDLQSKNGTFVNEQLINSHWLKPGDIVNIGDHSLIFYQDGKKANPAKRHEKFDDTLVMNSTDHRRRMIKSTSHKSINVVRFWDKSQSRGTVRDVEPQAAASTGKSETNDRFGTLTYIAGGEGQIELRRKIITIGKHSSSDIMIKGMLLDPTTATISKEPDGYWFKYIGGLPKPKINDITVTESTLLNDSDIIEIGSTRLQFAFEK
jgi:pSer/pThr/pTyr-binding forkhead associated (FHA) protein